MFNLNFLRLKAFDHNINIEEEFMLLLFKTIRAT